MLMKTKPKEEQVIDLATVDSVSRRKFLRQAITGAVTVMLVYGVPAAARHGRGKGWKQMSQQHQYAYSIDINKCIGWGGCVRACQEENNLTEDQFRTWIERYVLTEDGVYVDSPKGGAEGFQPVTDEILSKAHRAFFVPKMCNHCENPPCVQVCPVGATFKDPEGFVLIDHEHCIGCANCVQACPYGARFFNHEIGMSDKCTWCYHRVKRGQLPACVEACPTGARQFGDLLEPDSALSKLYRENQWMVLKPETHTAPTCFYISLPREVV